MKKNLIETKIKEMAVGLAWTARKFGTLESHKIVTHEIRETPDPKSRVIAVIEGTHNMPAGATECQCYYKLTMDDKTVEFNGPDSDLDVYQYIMDNHTSTH